MTLLSGCPGWSTGSRRACLRADTIRAALKLLPSTPQFAVFDTAFHQSMPPHAFRYALPDELYAVHGVRRYGFHGTSHKYVSDQASVLCGKERGAGAWLTAHLGNGCSSCAVLDGRSMDTSMGLTPLEGLVMGTRSGDVDPNLHAHLARTLGWDLPRNDPGGLGAAQRRLVR